MVLGISSKKNIGVFVNLTECKNALTSRIVGLAAEECGLLAYDPDNEFDIVDIMDPEFPMTERDVWPESDNTRTPAQFLEDLCESRCEFIVESVKEMEKTWSSGNLTDDCKVKKVVWKLWEFVKDEVVHHVEEIHGEDFKTAFECLGEALFGRNQS